MGLDIHGEKSGTDFSCSYSTYHNLRILAVFISKYYDWKSYKKNNKDSDILEKSIQLEDLTGGWNDCPEFWQILHFSDCEGSLVQHPRFKDRNYKDSFYMGSLPKLADEVKQMKCWIDDNPSLIDMIEKRFYIKSLFERYYNCIIAEQNVKGTIKFS